MIVRLRVFGALEQYFGGSHLQVELPAGATLRDLLDAIDAGWGERLPQRFWDADARRFRGPVLMLADNADLEDDALRLSDQQQVSILVPMAGGC